MCSPTNRPVHLVHFSTVTAQCAVVVEFEFSRNFFRQRDERRGTVEANACRRKSADFNEKELYYRFDD